MTHNEFRRIALGLTGAAEGAHMGHPDFRLDGRIFATLHTDLKSGMVKLTPEQQSRVLEESPAMFSPEAGAWGRQGCTRVHLEAADPEVLGDAITLAWQNAGQKAKTKNLKPKKLKPKNTTAASPKRRRPR